MPEVAEWKFPGSGWQQVYRSAERIGMGSFTLAVSDLDDQVTALQQLGLEPGRQMGSGKVVVVMLKDPDGNSIAFVEATDRSMAQ